MSILFKFPQHHVEWMFFFNSSFLLLKETPFSENSFREVVPFHLKILFFVLELSVDLCCLWPLSYLVLFGYWFCLGWLKTAAGSVHGAEMSGLCPTVPMRPFYFFCLT